MARSSRFDRSRTTRRAKQRSTRRSAQRSSNHSPTARPLRLEALEVRRVLAALVGVDFGTGSVPPNWTQVASVGNSSFPSAVSNLIDESGAATAVDLSIFTSFSGGAPNLNATIVPATLPQHTPSLANVSNIVFVDSADGSHSFSAAFKDLKPGFTYEVYVFGLESEAGVTDSQTVTLSGGSPNIVFAQNPIAGGNLWVNDQVGSSSAAAGKLPQAR